MIHCLTLMPLFCRICGLNLTYGKPDSEHVLAASWLDHPAADCIHSGKRFDIPVFRLEESDRVG